MGDENSSQDTAFVMERWKELRAIGNAIILIHHTQKANEQVFRGSQALIDQADHVLYFYPVRKPGQDDPVEFDDPDSLTYYLGTREKTRYRHVKVYVKRAGKGRFVLAGDPDDEKIESMKDLLGGDGLTQGEFLRAAKGNLGYGKTLTLRLLKRGEDRGAWTVEKGNKNSCRYLLSVFSTLKGGGKQENRIQGFPVDINSVKDKSLKTVDSSMFSCLRKDERKAGKQGKDDQSHGGDWEHGD